MLLLCHNVDVVYVCCRRQLYTVMCCAMLCCAKAVSLSANICYAVSCLAMLHHYTHVLRSAMSCFAVPCCITTLLCCALLCCVLPCHAASLYCCAALCYAVSCLAMLHHYSAVLHSAMLCLALPCCITTLLCCALLCLTLNLRSAVSLLYTLLSWVWHTTRTSGAQMETKLLSTGCNVSVEHCERLPVLPLQVVLDTQGKKCCTQPTSQLHPGLRRMIIAVPPMLWHGRLTSTAR